MIQLNDVHKVYPGRKGEVRALDGVTLSVESGEFVAIKGPSGSGKSTVLMVVGGMNRPTAGGVSVDGTELYAISHHERAQFRAERIGFVFQMFHLVPYLTVLDNVLLPTLALSGRGGRERALELLERFRMTERLHHKPGELSTGERQRAALARALLNEPKIVLADEPTGNLDPDNAGEVLGYLKTFRDGGGTVVLVTHEESALGHADRVVQINRGRVEDGAG